MPANQATEHVAPSGPSGALAALGIAVPALLAPMAGITDLPFRRAVRRFGAGLVTSEMVASREMVEAKPGIRARAETGAAEGTSVQLAGRDPRWMAEAARMLEDRGVRIIDINMGCPAKKVTGGWSGAALMREPGRALALIEAVAGAVRVPVTVKMRLGWDDASRTAPALARRAEAAGAAMIAVHGRTRAQFYRGRADWDAVGETVRAVRVPVVVNGDVTDTASARAALAASGAAAVMVGRGAQGAPWRVAEIGAALLGGPPPAVPEGPALADLVVAHHEDALSFYGADLGLRVMRKHLGWYLAGAPAALRRAALTAESPAEAHRFLRAAFGPVARAA